MRRTTQKASARKKSGITTAMAIMEEVDKRQDDAPASEVEPDGQGEQLTAPDCVHVFADVARVQVRLAEPEKPTAHCDHA